jgi:hypothetical protein
MTMTMTTPKATTASYAFLANAVLIPVKQHVICCGAVPALVSTGLGGGTGAWLATTGGQVAMGILVPPLVTGAVMWAEQKWHNRAAARKNATCCGHQHPMNQSLTKANFLRQTALGYAFYAAIMFMTADHRHDAAMPTHPTEMNSPQRTPQVN